jgi:hypothetical protein
LISGNCPITASEDLFAEYYGERTNYPSVYAVDYPRYFSIKIGPNNKLESEAGNVRSNNLERDYPKIYNAIKSRFKSLEVMTIEQIEAAAKSREQNRALHAKQA